MDDNCVFCKIVSKEIPTKIEAETESVIAFNSNQPAAKIHLLILPKKHISTFMDINEEDKDILSEMVKVAQHLVKDKKIEGGYKLGINGGKYQSVFHLHLHLLGGGLEDAEDIMNRT